MGQEASEETGTDLMEDPEFLTHVIEEGPAGITMVNTAGKLLYANRRAEAILGLKKSEIVGRTYDAPEWRITHFDGSHFPRQSTPFERVRREGVPVYGVEHAVCWPDGTRKCLYIDGVPLTAGPGGEGRIVFTIEDVTKRYEAECARREREAELKRAQALAGIGSWRLDFARRRAEASEEARRIYGMGTGELTLEAVLKVPLKEYRAYLDGALEGARERGEPYDVEFCIRRQTDGRIRRIHSVGEWDPGKEQLVGTLRDITEERATEEELRRREAQYRSLAEDLPLLMASFDANCVISYVNPSAATFFGRPAEAFTGKDFRIFLSDEEVRKTEEALATITPEEPVRVYEIDYTSEPAKEHVIRWYSQGLFDSGGKLVEVRGIGEDVTKEKALERHLVEARENAVKASEAKSAFLASMSHEIRTPLNGVIGMAEYLRQCDLPDEYGRCISLIHESGHHLMELINDILDFSKIEAGQLILDPKRVDLPGAINELLMLMDQRAQKKGLVLTSRLDLPAREYLVDVFRLKQVLLNLLGNAIKFTGRRGHVQLIVEEKGDGLLEFAVVDNGPGIEKSKQAKLFEPFIQADGSINQKFGGTGLGLAISRRIVEKMGGSIGLWSEPGKGSRFYFTLHCATKAGGDGQIRPEKKSDSGKTDGGLRVLVLDDDQINGTVLEKLLQARGISTTLALRLEEALEAAEGEEFGLLFIDLNMPGMSGLDFARGVREKRIARFSPETYLVAYTASATNQVRERCREAGFNDFLTKPITRESLRKVLEAYLMTSS